MGIYPLNAALNAIVLLAMAERLQVSEGVDLRDGVLAWVTEIRKSLARLKDPKLLKDVATDLAKRLSRTAWAKGGLRDVLIAKEGLLGVNNIWK